MSGSEGGSSLSAPSSNPPSNPSTTPRYFPQFQELSASLVQFCSSLTTSRAWQSSPTIPHLITFINLSLGSLHTTLWAWSPQSPGILAAAGNFSVQLLGLCSGFFAEAAVLPAPFEVSLAFCELLRSVSGAVQFHADALPASEAFEAASVAAATAGMAYAPNVSVAQSR